MHALNVLFFPRFDNRKHHDRDGSYSVFALVYLYWLNLLWRTQINGLLPSKPKMVHPIMVRSEDVISSATEYSRRSDRFLNNKHRVEMTERSLSLED